MSKAACYLQRAGGGVAMSGVRLADRRSVRQWSPTASQRAGNPRETAIAAARWSVQQLDGGESPDLVVCVDLDGASCGWLSAAGPDERSIRGAVRSAQGDERDESTAGPTPTWLKVGDIGSDLSVQALAVAPQNGTAKGRGRRRSSAATAERQRMAVLAVPDLAVRAFQDELDRLNQPTERIITLWHAVAEAWDPYPAEHNALSNGDNVVAEQQTCTATLVVEPDGRLIWAWAQQGRLLAAGSMRLARVAAPMEAPRADGEIADEQAAQTAATVIQVTRSDVGRLISDWMSWGMELGLAPAHIVCVGPPNIVPVGLATGGVSGSGLAELGAALGAAWPGAIIAANVDDDPISTTLKRIASAQWPEPAGPKAGAGAGAQPDTVDPRRAMVELSNRPGRSSRKLFLWTAASMVAAAVVVGVIGVRVGRNATSTYEQAELLHGERIADMEKVKPFAPKVLTEKEPARYLRAVLADMDSLSNSASPEKPILSESARLLTAAAQASGVTMTKFLLSSMTASATFTTPTAELGPTILEKLELIPGGPIRVGWNGRVTVGEKGITYSMTGAWVVQEPSAPGPNAPKESGGAPAGASAPGGAAANPKPAAAEKPTGGEAHAPAKPEGAKPNLTEPDAAPVNPAAPGAGATPPGPGSDAGQPKPAPPSDPASPATTPPQPANPTTPQSPPPSSVAPGPNPGAGVPVGGAPNPPAVEPVAPAAGGPGGTGPAGPGAPGSPGQPAATPKNAGATPAAPKPPGSPQEKP